MANTDMVEIVKSIRVLPSAPLSGLTVSFFAEPEPASRLDQRQAVTDTLGRAVFRADILAVPAQALLFRATLAGNEHVVGKARAEAFLKVKPTLAEVAI